MKKTDIFLSVCKVTLQRYGDLALLAVVVFVLFELFGKLPFVANVARGYAKFANSLNDMVLGLFMLVLALFSHGLLLKLGVIHPKRRIDSFWRYPSVLLSIYFVLLLAELSVGLLPEPFFNVPGGLILAALGNPNTLLYIVFFAVIHSAHILFSFRKRKADKNKRESSKTPERHTNAQTQSDSQPNPNESIAEQEADLFSLTVREQNLLNWVEKEVPLEDERELRFGREIYVNRITKRFQQAETSQHLALCGKFGSGKSSVLNLVCRKLENDERQNWLTVKINTWGRNPHSLGSYILEHMLNGASEHVDISALKPLPEHYRLALNAKGDWFSVFNQLLGNTNKTINEQFKRLEQVLNAINLKVLVILEDLDRNSNTQEMVTATAALVEQLRGFSKFHFAVAIGYTNNSADVISRVCDYREDLANEAYSDVFDDFLSIWVKRAKSGGMVLHSSYDELMATESLEGKSDETIHDFGRPSFYDVMNRVVYTPRVAKQICRRVDTVWKKSSLMGEIDLLDLLILQVVRETSPNLYQTLKSHSRDKFARLFDSGGTPKSNAMQLLAESFSDYEPLGEPIGEEKNKQLEKEQNRIKEKYPVIELLTFVFPFVRYYNYRTLINIQRIWNTDFSHSYFGRLEREALALGELRDQVFIRELQQYQRSAGKQHQNAEGNLVKNILTNPQYFERVAPFFNTYKLENKYAQRKWFLALIRNTLHELRTHPEQYLLEESTNDHSQANFSRAFIEYLYQQAPSYQIKAKTIDFLYRASMRWLMRHQFCALNEWLEIEEHLIKSMDTVNALLTFLKKGIQNEFLDTEMLTKRHRLLAYNAKEHLTWNYDADSNKLARYNFTRVWYTESQPSANDSVFHILLSKAQLPEDRPENERVHFMVLLMFFFFKHGTNLPKLESDDMIVKLLPEPFLAELKRVGLGFSFSQYETATGTYYSGEIDIWLNALRSDNWGQNPDR